MRLPLARGPLSERVVTGLLEAPPSPYDAAPRFPEPAGPHDEAVTLWTPHELHYRGFDEVDDRWEFAPALAPLTADLEARLETRLRERFARATAPARTDDLAEDIFAMVAAHDGPSVATHVQHRATHAELLQLLRERSVYHLKEADPTSWVVGRLEAGPKAALMEIQFDEYGGGRPERLHHHLFAVGMADLGLDATYGAYVDDASAEVLEQNNALSLFGLHRRLRGAAVGHLAAFEATSSVPSRKMAQGLRRLGVTGGLVDYYDEHVLADAVHDQLAARAVCAPLAAAHPELADDVLLGVFSCLDLEARSAARFLAGWQQAA